MTDVLGYRKKFAVLGPSTNTIVQPEFDEMRPVGVTNHYSRIYTPNAQAISDETFMAGTKVIAENVTDAVQSVLTCSPDYMVMGMSAITFYGGVEGANAFENQVMEAAEGRGCSTGAHSTAAALEAYGGIKRIAFISPYYPSANAEVKNFFEESGFEVVRDRCLQCPSWTAIAEVPLTTCRQVIVEELNGDDVDAIVQVGTNLRMARFAGELERFLAKPVVAINTATYWHALRRNGIEDKVAGFGRLLEEF